MRFQVPQFIEVEDRVFGPLTITQFIYLAGGFGFLGAMWLMLPLWAALILGGPVAGLGAALAFLKVNERPLIVLFEHAFQYYIKDKLYIWDKQQKSGVEIAKAAVERTEDPAQYVATATSNKIKDLSWSLDIKESLYTDKNQQK
jgi:hypothetical protein